VVVVGIVVVVVVDVVVVVVVDVVVVVEVVVVVLLVVVVPEAHRLGPSAVGANRANVSVLRGPPLPLGQRWFESDSPSPATWSWPGLSRLSR
jgi:hypothetical protein